MLFCEPHLLPMYTRRGYTQLSDEVWVDQPAGPITHARARHVAADPGDRLASGRDPHPRPPLLTRSSALLE